MHHRADGQHVDVGEADATVGAEILVRDVAATDDAELVVGDEGLVVHAPVQASEFAHVADGARSPVGEGVVEAQLDVRMRVECGQRRVEPGRIGVIEQEPHAHAALRRLPQRFEQQTSDLIVMPDEVLRIERLLRRLSQQHTGRERVVRFWKLVDARQARVRSDEGGDGMAKARAGSVSDGNRCIAVLRRRQARAARHKDRGGRQAQRKQVAHTCHGCSHGATGFHPAPGSKLVIFAPRAVESLPRSFW